MANFPGCEGRRAVIDPVERPELFTNAQMRAADAGAIAAGTPGIVLMERAGAAVARAAERMARTRGRIAVLCGPGANGGDGFVAARLLQSWGFRVELGLLGARGALADDAALAAARWHGAAAPASSLALAGADLIIDALFGAGLTRPLEGGARALVEAVNASGAPVLSIDLPSGVDGDSGKVLGAAVQASRSVTFHRLKLGHVLLPGLALAGELVLADIGLPAPAAQWPRVIGPADFHAAWRAPAIGGHKYSRGAALVLSGGAHGTGAARLSAQAALRIGAGIVTLASPPEAAAINAAHCTAVMVAPFDGLAGFAKLLADPRRTSVLIGPGAGVGEATRGFVRAALSGKRTVVLDADALTSFAGQFAGLARAVRDGGADAVITPHEGEFARLFAGQAEVLAAPNKVERAKAAARALGGVVLLKGADTVVAAPDGRTAVGFGAPPTLATAGSGDVLAGLIAGLAAQGAGGFEAAKAGAFLHGRLAAGAGLSAEDFVRRIPAAVNALCTTR